MAKHTNLDMDVLRTFVTAFEVGSFARAADRVGRSQSAVSTQLRKLEDQVGHRLVRKAGRGLALTEAGETLRSYAKRLLELNDEAIARIRGADLEGWVKLGVPHDFAEGWLSSVFRLYAQACPRVRLEVHVEPSAALAEKVLRGELDIALVWSDGSDGVRGAEVAEMPMAWIGPKPWVDDGTEPVPFAAFTPPCIFRSAALGALEKVGRPWRLVFTTPTLAGLWAAAEGGLGVTVRTTIGMPANLAVIPAVQSLPALPAARLRLTSAAAEPEPAVARLSDILVGDIRERVGRSSTEQASSSN